MKTVFIINPMAGQGKNIVKLSEHITETANKLNANVEIYITKAVGDAQRFVNDYCKNYGVARFIACGGDGTLNEVVNGAISYEGTEVGVLPMGTGNDFCRNFDYAGTFDKIDEQINGGCIKCDAIRYCTNINGHIKTGYCVNMFNIGFDCNVADMTANMKTKPFVSGALAYLLSIFATLIKKNGANLNIELDGDIKHSGQLLLISVANGCFCGGGIKSNPLASVQDGFINVNIIKNISRIKLMEVLPHYMKGDFLQLKNIDTIISSLKCKKAVITPVDDMIRLCVDGEIIDAGVTGFEIVPEAFNFVIPVNNINKEIPYVVQTGR